MLLPSGKRAQFFRPLALGTRRTGNLGNRTQLLAPLQSKALAENHFAESLPALRSSGHPISPLQKRWLSTTQAEGGIAQFPEANKTAGFKESRNRKKAAFAEDLKFLLFLACLGLTLYITFEVLPHLKSDLLNEGLTKFLETSKIKETLAKDLQNFIKEQGPALRKALVDEILEHQDVKDFALRWAVDRAKECCADPSLTVAMGSLISSAVELPSTKSTVGDALKEILNSQDTQASALSFVKDTLSHQKVKSQVANISKETLENLVNDPQVQTDLWMFMKKSLLPKWANSDKPPTLREEVHAWSSRLKLANRK